MGGVTAGHLGRCACFIQGATPQDAASGADCVAAPSRELREQAWVRAFLVNGGSRHGSSSGKAVRTPTTVRMTHTNTHWCCRSNTVTKQQEASHTDHWHCIVIEIWVSISLSLSLSAYFSIVSAPAAEHILLCRFLFLHLLLLCNIPSFFCSTLPSVLHPSSSSTESSQTVSSLQLQSSVHAVFFNPFCAAHSFPCCAHPLHPVVRPVPCSPSSPLHFAHTHGFFVHLQSP